MNMKSPAPTRAEMEAGEWLATMSQRLVSIDQRNEFEAWMKTDPEHAAAYERGRGIFQLAGGMSDLLEEIKAEESAMHALQRKRLRYAAMAASVILAVGAAFFAAREFSWFGLPDRFETSTAQVKDIQLEDGTLVTLGAASTIDVDFGKHERRVKLTRGEAFFEVTRDTSRPFFVMAGETLVRVVGTKFDVHYGPQAVRVAVVEGKVKVMHAPGARGPSITGAAVSNPSPGTEEGRDPRSGKGEVNEEVLLTAGDTALATKAGAIVTSNYPNKADFGAWRQGRLVYVDARLKDIVSDMDRYFDGEITLADDALGEQRLTITFHADEIDRVLQLLQEALPLRAVRTSAERILLTRQ